MEEIIEYLRGKYHPLAILLCGSFSRGTNDEFSDFDCTIIVKDKPCEHDGSVIAGIQLDCFIYTENEAAEEDAERFLAVYDAKILEDNGCGAALKERVREYVASHSRTDDEEKLFISSWIRKTMRRMQKGDDEGNFRAAAFLCESLTDYFLLRDMFYLGSRKAIAYLRENDAEGYALFHEAVSGRSNESIRKWAEYVAANC